MADVEQPTAGERGQQARLHLCANMRVGVAYPGDITARIQRRVERISSPIAEQHARLLGNQSGRQIVGMAGDTERASLTSQ